MNARGGVASGNLNSREEAGTGRRQLVWFTLAAAAAGGDSNKRASGKWLAPPCHGKFPRYTVRVGGSGCRVDGAE